MGPKTAEELEVWTRFACALAGNPNYDDVRAVKDADWMIGEWRKRSDAIGADERAEADAKRRATRERMNARPWGQEHGLFYRDLLKEKSNGYHFDRARLEPDGSLCVARFEMPEVEVRITRADGWPADMGNPPPGWGAP